MISFAEEIAKANGARVSRSAIVRATIAGMQELHHLAIAASYVD